MNKAYTWDEYWYAVNDCLLSGNYPVLTRDDAAILELCWKHCYREMDAARAVLTDRENRR